MSLHQLANHMSAQGRGPDSTLVHMSPREVSGLQSLAMANGGTLTINPETGLPEAGFLDSLLPTLIGGAATYFTGGAINPMLLAAGVGGLTALTSKDLGKGLMAGLGAYGGSSIVSGLAGLGTGAMSAEAGGAAVQAAGVNPFGLEADMLAQNAIAPKLANASYYDKLAAGASKAMSNPGDALSAFGGGSKLKGAAMFAGPAMAAFSAVDEPKTTIPEKSKTAFIRSYYKDPETGQQMANRAIPAEDWGTRNFGERIHAANGGLMALAGGGQTAYDYLDRKRSTSSDGEIVVDDTPPKPSLPPTGSDGKGSYIYNKELKKWVWTPDAKPVVPVNPGVAVLIGEGGGNDGDTGPKSTPDWDTTNNIGNFLSNMGLNTIGDYLQQAAKEGQADSRMETNAKTGAYSQTAQDQRAAEAQAQAAANAAAIGDMGFNDVNTGNTGTNTNTGTTGMNTGTTGGSPAQAGDISNPGGPNQGSSGPTGVAAGNISGAGDGGFGPADTGNFGDSNPDSIANGGMVGRYAQGGLGSLGGYSDGGRLLRGPGDGVSDSIPASIGDRQPARLADGEFVVPARIVSELGNGSTEAGARALYKMMDRIQANRRKTTGKNKVAVNSKSHKYLPA